MLAVLCMQAVLCGGQLGCDKQTVTRHVKGISGFEQEERKTHDETAHRDGFTEPPPATGYHEPANPSWSADSHRRRGVRLWESYQNIKEKERHEKAEAEARRERKEKANNKKKRTLRTRTSGTQSSAITHPRA